MTSFFSLRRRKRTIFHDMELDYPSIFEHLAIFGGSGSGKSSFLLVAAIAAFRLGGERLGCLWAAVKSEEKEAFFRVMKEAGALDRVIHLVPGSFAYNFLAWELMRKGGSYATAMELLVDMNRLTLRNGGGEGSDQFWENLFKMLGESAILLCWLARREKVTIEDVYNLVVSVPSSFDQAASEKFREQSFCWQMIEQAGRNLQSESERREYQQATNFVWKELVSLGSKAKGAAQSNLVSLLRMFLRSPIYESVCCQTNSFTPEMALSGHCVLMDAPVKVYGPVGVMLQNLIVGQTTTVGLQRHNPDYDTIIMRDEAPELIGSPHTEISNLALARSARISFWTLCQSIPNLQVAFGNHAESGMLAYLTNHAIRVVLSTGCVKTAQFFSQFYGEVIEQMVSVSERQPEQEFNLLNTMLGDDGLSFSCSSQYRPRISPSDIFSLRRGGKVNRLCVDFLHSQAGRTYGPNASPVKFVTFKQI
ncbi:MAG: TraM recognition domain-containing protein [Planctomycetota bacterium]